MHGKEIMEKRMNLRNAVNTILAACSACSRAAIRVFCRPALLPTISHANSTSPSLEKLRFINLFSSGYSSAAKRTGAVASPEKTI